MLQEREREVGGAEAGQELVYEHKGMTADQPKWIKNWQKVLISDFAELLIRNKQH